jgi:hypothetical protein
MEVTRFARRDGPKAACPAALPRRKRKCQNTQNAKSQKTRACDDPSRLWTAGYSAKSIERKRLCMRPVLERGVPQEQRQRAALGSLTDWAAPDLEAVRLGRMHLMFFASQKYLETYGTPRTAGELVKHRLVMQVADRAVAHGAGIGIFPTYASTLGGKIIPLEVELRRPYDIWLSYHPGNGRIARTRQMIDWLVDTYNPAKFPWFKDEFLHPSEFKGVYKGETLTQLFGGFSIEGR